MFSKMSVIAFTAGLVATLCVSDVNAVVLETCLYTDDECTAVIAGSCLAGSVLQEGSEYDFIGWGEGDYDNRQDPEDDGVYVGMSDYTSCTAYAEAQYQKNTEYNYDGSMDGYYHDYNEMVAELTKCSTQDGQYTSTRCIEQTTSTSTSTSTSLSTSDGGQGCLDSCGCPTSASDWSCVEACADTADVQVKIDFAAKCTDVELAIVLESCSYADWECTAVIAGSCLAGSKQGTTQGDIEDYARMQNPENDEYYAAMSEYTTCTAFAEAQYKKISEHLAKDNDSGEARDYDTVDEMVAEWNKCAPRGVCDESDGCAGCNTFGDGREGKPASCSWMNDECQPTGGQSGTHCRSGLPRVHLNTMHRASLKGSR